MTIIIIDDPKRIGYQELKPWKYRTTQNHRTNVGIFPPKAVNLQRKDGTIITMLEPNGTLFIAEGYAWDGASGPTYDSPDTMRPSLYHDVGYQFMRKGVLDKKGYKDQFDRVLERTMVEDGNVLAAQLDKQGGFMNKAKAVWIRNTIKARAAAWYQAVKNFAGGSCDPGPEPIDQEIIAP